MIKYRESRRRSSSDVPEIKRNLLIDRDRSFPSSECLSDESQNKLTKRLHSFEYNSIDNKLLTSMSGRWRYHKFESIHNIIKIISTSISIILAKMVLGQCHIDVKFTIMILLVKFFINLGNNSRDYRIVLVVLMGSIMDYLCHTNMEHPGVSISLEVVFILDKLIEQITNYHWYIINTMSQICFMTFFYSDSRANLENDLVNFIIFKLIRIWCYQLLIVLSSDKIIIKGGDFGHWAVMNKKIFIELYLPGDPIKSDDYKIWEGKDYKIIETQTKKYKFQTIGCSSFYFPFLNYGVVGFDKGNFNIHKLTRNPFYSIKDNSCQEMAIHLSNQMGVTMLKQSDLKNLGCSIISVFICKFILLLIKTKFNLNIKSICETDR